MAQRHPPLPTQGGGLRLRLTRPTGCKPHPEELAQQASRRMDATLNSRPSFETPRCAWLLRMRSEICCSAARFALCFTSRASEISRRRRDKTTRRANHPKVGQSHLRKIFCFSETANQSRSKTVSPDERGGSRSSRTCGGMRWTRWRRMTSAVVADGEAVWSWHPDAGVKFAGSKTSRG